MSTVLPIPILNELAPNTFSYGSAYLIEFEPHSLWYESTFAITAAARGSRR